MLWGFFSLNSIAPHAKYLVGIAFLMLSYPIACQLEIKLSPCFWICTGIDSWELCDVMEKNLGFAVEQPWI